MSANDIRAIVLFGVVLVWVLVRAMLFGWTLSSNEVWAMIFGMLVLRGLGQWEESMTQERERTRGAFDLIERKLDQVLQNQASLLAKGEE